MMGTKASLLRFAATVVGGAAAGAVVGHIGKCTSGTCPLTSTWWRGALYGAVLGLLIASAGSSE